MKTVVLTLNKISDVIYDVLPEDYEVSADAENPDLILVRSQKMDDYRIGDRLAAIGRAGAGVNNIPVEEMSKRGIAVFNTPGANANAVKELVILSMLLASRDVVEGIEWASGLRDTAEADVAKQVEKGKSKFAGHEILGKTLGVFGLGAIGTLVANTATALGMNVLAYDAHINERKKNALFGGVTVCDLDDFVRQSDILTLHIPLVADTKGIVNSEFIAKMKNGATLINTARAELVDTASLKEALGSGKISKYVVDFPKADTVGVENIIAIPHLGASTEESEDKCAEMAAKELTEFYENGNVANSVNFPTLSKPRDGKRTTIVAQATEKDKIRAIAPNATIAERGEILYGIIDGEADAEALKPYALKVRALG